ncbi:uncharacterized protein LOC131677600 [Topomyia yanbarensis]|uniref:uncharacterized protein LOC131677600 n=1 Tax=Topomyia yanbarensis TaxID=2498891 RepID=UPI00273A8360|nr:uncharacterized protein LOC131677600 [Topomyia yanbarensis]
MVLLAEIYCPEQIVIPENFNNVLKAYAKAVIRTQPYDLLRWSAAYFRCMALERTPPVKPRYEPEAHRGKLTTGALRTLIDQLGKGFFVQKRYLFEKWQGLCLPEEELLNILSLLRTLDWTHLHWLKIVAIFIGLLSDSLVRTAEMICELLTEEPEGGPSPVPLWMFKECFLTVARLDCGSVQTFVDGRKVLEDGRLEEKQPMTEMPKVLSTISFKNAIIDKYKSFMGIDAKSAPTDAELLTGDDRFSEISEIPSKLDSDFKFVGDETDPYEVARRAPDFDSVIILLSELQEDKLHAHLSAVSIAEEKLERAKERSQRLDDLRESLPEYDYEKLMEAERQQLLKDMGPPWLLLYLFSRSANRHQSYNFIEETSDDESASGYSEDSCLVRGAEDLERSPEPEESRHDIERRRSSYSIPASVRSRMSSIHSSATRIANEVLSRIICMVDEAIIDGECELSVPSIASFIEQKSHETTSSISEHDFATLREFLEEAEKKELEVKDLNELYHFFVGESFKMMGDVDELQRDRSKEITSIFESSGIEVDHNLLDAQIAENMILGLVQPEQPSEREKEQGPSSSPQTNQSSPFHGSLIHAVSSDLQAVLEEPTEDITAAAATDEQDEKDADKTNNEATEKAKENISADDKLSEGPVESKLAHPGVATQTDPFGNKCMELMRRQTLTRKSELTIEYSCRIAPIPGIGSPLSEETIQTFLEYLAKRAIHQQGLIYPRNFREPPCPKIT